MSLCRSRASQIIGHGYEQFTNYLTVLLLFILICNLIGLLSPWFESPTANVTVPLGFALVTFVYYHYHGVRANGFGYIKQFLGPVWWLYPLLFPIEIISHLARVLVADGSFVCEYVCGRPADPGVLLADSDWYPAAVSRAALRRGYYPGVCVHAAGCDLSEPGGGARSLRAGIREQGLGIRKTLKFPWAGAPCLWCVLPPIQREGASTVSLNHPLAARSNGGKEL